MSLAQEHPESPFEAMPLELHFKVLSHMSGPEDVLSAIQASPATLRALQTGREHIYVAVLQNRLAPEVFREFLAIANAPDHNTCPSVGPPQTDDEWADDRESTLKEWAIWEQRAGDFLRDHALGAVYSTPSPKTNPTEFKNQTRLMIRLYFLVSRLISYYLPYTRNRRDAIDIDLPPTDDVAHEGPSLTATELLRLQRGFLRYELCCRLIGIPSIAAFCNRRVFDAVVAPYEGQSESRLLFWETDPITRLLPLDEVEEVICVAEFVLGLYNRLRCTFVEDFEGAVLDLSQGAELRDREDISSHAKTTVRMRLCLDGPFQAWAYERYFPYRWGGRVGVRLGLPVLDRVIRSTPTDRRAFMRAAFYTFRHLSEDTLRPLMDDDTFLRPGWNAITQERGHFYYDEHRRSPIKVGPHCNAILKTCSTDRQTIALICDKLPPFSLRKLGWAFFDDQSTIRSLKLPQDHSPSGLQDWMLWESRNPNYECLAEMGDAALDAEFTDHEWNQLLERYSPKDLRGDFQAMSRFVADVRAVVDFRSDRVPQMV